MFEWSFNIHTKLVYHSLYIYLNLNRNSYVHTYLLLVDEIIGYVKSSLVILG